jgi:hypothetical protein
MTFQSLIIFDWDNTLLPSTFLTQNECTLHKDIPSNITQQISSLEELNITLITIAQQYGQVAIITNSENGWIEMSCNKYFPNLTDLLDSVTILSARTMFEPQHPKEPTEWKKQAFFHLLEKNPHINHIISIGDSEFEHIACRHIAKTKPNITTKLIKMIELPSIDLLQTQINLITKAFSTIHNYTTHTELSVC